MHSKLDTAVLFVPAVIMWTWVHHRQPIHAVCKIASNLDQSKIDVTMSLDEP